MNRFLLLRALHENRTLFEEAISGVLPRYLLEPVGDPRESAKDIIAHLTTWETRFTNWLQVLLSGDVPQAPEPGASWRDRDRLNAEGHQASQSLTLDEVLAASTHSYHRLLQLIDGISDDMLAQSIPYSFIWLKHERQELGKPLWKTILGGPCYAHYQDHIAEFMLRWDPLQRPTLSGGDLWPLTGRYHHPEIGTIGLRIDETDSLSLQSSWDTQDREIRGLPLDATRVAFPGLGLLSFSFNDADEAVSVEYWTNTFERLP